MKTEKENFFVSVVIPVMNEEGNIVKLTKKMVAILQAYSRYEIIYVDDGSFDSTLDSIKKQHSENGKIKYISFSRNFGHQNALRAGLDFASGDCVISMDGDGQHPPELIPELVKKWEEGYDIVYTIRKDDPKNTYFKRKTSSFFYRIMNAFSDVKIQEGMADFRLMDRKVVEVVRTLREHDLFMRGMSAWLGFRQFGITYMPERRVWGKTKYTLRKMVKFAITGITSFSTKPLRISTLLGYVMALLSFFYGVYAIGIKLFTQEAVSGWTSVLVGIFFIGGIQMIMMGILGEYVGKLFIESKNRPNYIIREKEV